MKRKKILIALTLILASSGIYAISSKVRRAIDQIIATGVNEIELLSNTVLYNQKVLKFKELAANGANYISLGVEADLSGDVEYTLPSADGSNGDCLTTDGTGGLSFAACSGSSTSPTIFGSTGTPRAIVAGTGITSGASHMSTTAVTQVVYVEGSGGAVDISANPQISDHTVEGAIMYIVGTDDTNTVEINVGSNVQINSPALLYDDSVLTLMWDGSDWQEVARHGIAQRNILIDANISGSNISMGTSNQTAYVGLENAGLALTNNTSKGSDSSVQIPCSSTNSPSGSTCSAGSESVGIAFTLGAGQLGLYEVCAAFAHHVSITQGGPVDATFQLVETAPNAQTVLQQGGERLRSRLEVASSANTNSGKAIRLCGTFNFTTSGQKAIRLMYEQSVTSTGVSENGVTGDDGANNGNRDIKFVMRKL
jgi:hypothetical protein